MKYFEKQRELNKTVGKNRIEFKIIIKSVTVIHDKDKNKINGS
jgi:hypothetical protein